MAFDDLPENLRRVRERVAAACERADRSPDEVRILAVTKGHPIDAIHAAVTMPRSERNSRLKRLRSGVRRQDINWWVDGFLTAAANQKLSDYPVIPRYVEQLDVKRAESGD